MERATYHSHTTVSDGKNSPEEMVEEAIRLGFTTIALTDHYRFPKGFRDWGYGYSDEAFETLQKVKEKYKDKINVLVGAEFDYLEDYMDYYNKEVDSKTFDWKILSCHFIKCEKEYIPIEWTREGFEQIIKESGGIKGAVKKYYVGLREGIKTGKFDSVGHIDIIKFWNKDSKYFDEKEEWYKEEIEKTLKEIKKQGMVLDLNTSGWRKVVGMQYPSEGTMKKAIEMGIELKYGSDAHKKEDLSFEFDRAVEMVERLKN